MALNPFVWDRPLEDLAKIVGMDDFASEVALILKASTNVAIFGARDTGKSTFLTALARELAREHGDDAPPYAMIRVDLKRALSIPAFIACVDEALRSHPSSAVRRAAARELEVLERELGFDLKLLKGSVRRGPRQAGGAEEMLHAQLRSLTRLASHVVVCFDEFQRLNRCPGEPLAIVGSALMGTGQGNTSVLFTGSIREYLEMLLNNSREPIFNQATKKRLPSVGRADFHEWLTFQFEATGRAIDESALDHLLAISDAHPKRTQQLAWATWQRGARRALGVADVQAAFEELMDDQQADFAILEETLANGEEQEATERKALYLLADHAGEGLASRTLAERYGLGAHTAARKAMPRLARRGLVEQAGSGRWRIIDPFLGEWLRRNSPFAEAG
jgi:GNAT superfamily N-acetyltransferase/energy-coupling factor transporter ATP-binding protein EcfA2